MILCWALLCSEPLKNDWTFASYSVESGNNFSVLLLFWTYVELQEPITSNRAHSSLPWSVKPWVLSIELAVAKLFYVLNAISLEHFVKINSLLILYLSSAAIHSSTNEYLLLLLLMRLSHHLFLSRTHTITKIHTRFLQRRCRRLQPSPPCAAHKLLSEIIFSTFVAPTNTEFLKQKSFSFLLRWNRFRLQPPTHFTHRKL